MSFMLTQEQFKNKTKRVTRRNGWEHARVGDIINGVEKCQGLKKGEKLAHLGQIVFTDVRRERLDAITQEDVILEGFPDMTPSEFVAFYGKHNKKAPSDLITRLAYDYLDLPLAESRILCGLRNSWARFFNEQKGVGNISGAALYDIYFSCEFLNGSNRIITFGEPEATRILTVAKKGGHDIREISKAESEGQLAAWQNRGLSDCPYTDERATDWRRGYERIVNEANRARGVFHGVADQLKKVFQEVQP